MRGQLLIAALLVGLSAGAQEVVKLWTGVPPLSVENKEYKEGIIYSGGDEDKPRIAKVTDPTIEIFRPKGWKNRQAAVIVCPGGGYAYLSYDDEGQKVARALAEQGFTACVLKYRLPNDAISKSRQYLPLADAQRAIRIVRQRAEELGVKQVGIMGFSAGGHLAATASTRYGIETYPTKGDTTSARPDFTVLGYAVSALDNGKTHKGTRQRLVGGLGNEEEMAHELNPIEHIDAKTPPAFIFHASDDNAVSPVMSCEYHNALMKNKVTAELHIFSKGKHGFGLGKGLRAEAWLRLFVEWYDELTAQEQE